MASWLSKHLGIRLDSHTLGNLVKNVAPVAGTVVGGPAGLLLAGGLGAGGEALRGKTGIGDLVKAGVSNASLAGAGQAGKSLLSHALTPAANPNVVTSALPGPSSLATQAVDGAPALAGTAAPSAGLPAISTPISPTTFADKVGNAARSAGSFIKDNPTAAGQIGAGAGNLATAGPRNAEAAAQTGLLRQQLEQNQYDLARRKASDLALEPIRQALYGKLSQNLGYQSPTGSS